MQSRKRHWLRDRKGFALILVFSLASIVLLLGLSLVSLTQVESASSRYDQGLRVARANARLALQMALGDLQELAGPDQRITATADGRRAILNEDFNAPSSVDASKVYQPFWTGVWDIDNLTDNPSWLVTRPLIGIPSVNPYTDDSETAYDAVTLVRSSTAEPADSINQPLHDVVVPKEAIRSNSIVGFVDAEEATIGHYAYWVGDNGVKASYLLEDFVPEVAYDNYGPLFDHDGDDLTPDTSYEQLRLKQMVAHRNHLEVDGTLVDVSDARLAAIVSEFALRDEEESGISVLGAGAGSFTKNDVRRRFHDFAGLSKGLLADTVRGGLKEDLSIVHAVNTPDFSLSTDTLVNHHLMPYLNLSSLTVTAPTELSRSYAIAMKDEAFGVGTPRPTVAPLITEFRFMLWLSVPEFGAPPAAQSNLYCKFGASVELWNPYTSRVDGQKLIVRIVNLDQATGVIAKYYPQNAAVVENPGVGLLAIMDNVTDFEIPAPAAGENWWAPGEAMTFTGAYLRGTGAILNPGNTFPLDPSFEYEINQAILPRFNSVDYSLLQDEISLEGPVWSPVVALLTEAGEELYRFQLDGISFNELKSSPTAANDVIQPHLSYKWELRDPDDFWVNHDPRSGLITSELIIDYFDDPSDPPVGYDPISMGYFEYPGSNKSFTESTLQTSAVDLLAANADGDVKNNIPIFELPRQEFLSFGALQHAEFPSGVRYQLGMSNATNPALSINDVFDRFFLSTVPQANPTTWTVDDPLPNGRMRPVSGSTEVDFQDANSAEHLYLKGAFNINSTSVEAWTALLKGVRLGSWIYEDPLGSIPVAGQSTHSFVDMSDPLEPLENQFLRFSQSAEETWRGDFDATPLDVTRERMRKGVRTLTDAEIELLALNIVKGIRTRRQAVAGKVGPFVSLQDFIDAGVIETAIADSNLNAGIAESYSSQFLTQQDVLTAIAPYLSARSDTFVVRAYGDAVNPFDADEIVARAYCEAIVQRIHEKHETDPNNTDQMIATGSDPGQFGRKFKVIAFRWMTGDEL